MTVKKARDFKQEECTCGRKRVYQRKQALSISLKMKNEPIQYK